MTSLSIIHVRRGFALVYRYPGGASKLAQVAPRATFVRWRLVRTLLTRGRRP